MKNSKQYYKELGILACALAKADGQVQVEEINALKEFIAKELSISEIENDSSGMNKAFYTDFEFDEELKKITDPEHAIRNFIIFTHRNAEDGDEKLINQSISLLEKISQAFHEGNEEKIILKVKSEIRELLPILKNK